MTFNDRTTYIAFRQEWKESYAQLSQDILALKLDIKNAMRKGISTGSFAADNMQNKLRSLQQIATHNLEQLAEAKVEAARQYEELKNAA